MKSQCPDGATMAAMDTWPVFTAFYDQEIERERELRAQGWEWKEKEEWERSRNRHREWEAERRSGRNRVEIEWKGKMRREAEEDREWGRERDQDWSCYVGLLKTGYATGQIKSLRWLCFKLPDFVLDQKDEEEMNVDPNQVT